MKTIALVTVVIGFLCLPFMSQAKKVAFNTYEHIGPCTVHVYGEFDTETNHGWFRWESPCFGFGGNSFNSVPEQPVEPVSVLPQAVEKYGLEVDPKDDPDFILSVFNTVAENPDF